MVSVTLSLLTVWSTPSLVAFLPKRSTVGLVLAVGLLLSSVLSLGTPPEPFNLGPINEDSVDAYANALVHTRSGGVLQVRIDSPGGDGYQLLRLLGLSDEASHRQITIVCRVSGVAASAAAVYFVVGCDRRLMGPKATLLFHNAYIRRDLPFAI